MTPQRTTVVGQTCEGKPVTWGQIERAVEEMRECLKLKTTTGAFSCGFVYQLAAHYCRIPQLFAGRELLVAVHSVMDQISVLENADHTRAVRTQPEAPLEGLLKGLHHKHWFQAAFIPANLSNEMQKHGDMLIWKFLNDEFGRDEWVGQPVNEGVAGKLARVATIDAFNNRTGNRAGSKTNKFSRLTGEWIVFAKSNRRNIYLTLATHDEPNQLVLARCSTALSEFPELASSEPFVTAAV
jgi:hypothetical protein